LMAGAYWVNASKDWVNPSGHDHQKGQGEVGGEGDDHKQRIIKKKNVGGVFQEHLRGKVQTIQRSTQRGAEKTQTASADRRKKSLEGPHKEKSDTKRTLYCRQSLERSPKTQNHRK